MLRRQALGTIALNSNNNLQNAGKPANQIVKGGMSKSANNVNPIFNQMQFNDENEPPQFALSSLESAAATKKCDEFEIFQEQQLLLTAKNGAASKIVIGSTNSNKENLLFKSEVDEEEEESEEEESEVEDNEEEEDEEEEEESEEEEDDDSEETSEQEEGISRLNLAALPEADADYNAANLSNLELMMDSSSVSASNLTGSSPMVLDDTIRFMSKLEDEDAKQFYYDEEEEDLEAKKRLEAENVLMNMVDYKDDIMKYMRKLEQELRPKANYMKKQMDITASMRSILVDWLVEVSDEYKLNTESLYQAVNYTDRFLSQMSVLRSKLQLVGTASMYIAAKYEEITPPDVNEFVYITDDTYTKKQVLRMEHLLLKCLDFRVSQPTANWFLTTFLKFMKLNTNLSQSNNSDLFHRIEYLSRFLAELTLLDCETFLNFLPSQIAASAVYISLHTLNKPWTKQIAEILGYSHDLSELKPCITEMFKMYQQAATLPQQAIQEKYKQAKYEHVSLINAPKSLPLNFQLTTNSNLMNST